MATDFHGEPGPRLVSALPGRRRYVWPLLQDSEAACAALGEWLGRWPGMRRARAYSLSGSFVITFDPGGLDPEALEGALEAWQPPAATVGMAARGHRSHDLWGAALLGNLLFRHLVLERSRPLRGERLGHLAVTLSVAGLLPLVRGVLGGREPSPHALEILLGAASVLTGEHRRTTGLVWLLHLPEMMALLGWLRRRRELPPNVT